MITHQVHLKQKELRDLAGNCARKHALATQRKLNEVGDKGSKMLAWLKWKDLGRNWVQVKQGPVLPYKCLRLFLPTPEA